MKRSTVGLSRISQQPRGCLTLNRSTIAASAKRTARNFSFSSSGVFARKSTSIVRSGNSFTGRFGSREAPLLEVVCRSYRTTTPQEQEAQAEQPTPSYLLPHPLWKGEYVDAVEITHLPPRDLVEKAAYYSVRLMRFNFDWMSGYSYGQLSEQKCLSRILYLETVAGVPGSVAAMLRHLRSLRNVKRDHGWIHTLLEEAENERMHMLVGLQLKKPGPLFRAAIWITQGIFTNFFFLAYMVSPHFCHRFVGYLEEEAVKTYTKLLQEIDHGCLQHWKTQEAPKIAKDYWKLPSNATMREVIAVIRADEAHHRNVNHAFSAMRPDEDNPFPPGH